MSSTATSFLQPNLQLFRCLKPSKTLSPPSKLVFSSFGLLPKKPSLPRNSFMASNSIVELIKLLPDRNHGNADEAARVFPRDENVQGSSELGPLLVSNRLQYTLNRLSKWLIAGIFAVVILCRHDGLAMWAAMGSVMNSMLSLILKKILNQERPVASMRSEPGMPSSHSQSIFYIFMFACFSLVEWLGLNVVTLIISGLTLAFGAYLSWLRISHQLHTTSQVVVGAIIGTIFSIFWYWSWNAVVHKAFITSAWVRIVVALGATGFCIGFLVYVILYWFRDER